MVVMGSKQSAICNFPFVYPFSENRCFVDYVIVHHMKRQIEGSDLKFLVVPFVLSREGLVVLSAYVRTVTSSRLIVHDSS